VVDINCVESILYLHVLNMRDGTEVERFRESLLATERQLVKAIGSREDLERLYRASADEALTQQEGSP
jgi:multicomponent Na+:H+ antiporter subunit E